MPARDDDPTPRVVIYHMRYTVESDETESWQVYEYTDKDGAPEPSAVLTHECVPDEVDLAEGKSPAMLAAEYIREAGISGEYAPSGHPGYPGPGTWYKSETETVDHYTGMQEEITAHLWGKWTDAECMEIWQRVIA